MSRILAVPFAVAAVTVPVVHGALPGKPVALTAAARRGGNAKVAVWRPIGKPRPAGPHDSATCPKGD